MRISDWSSDVCSSDLSRPNISAFLPKGLLSRIITATELADTDEFGRQNVGALILCLVRRRTLQRLHPPHTFGYCRTMHKDRQSVGSGKSVSVRVDLGGRRVLKKKNTQYINITK